MFYVFTRMVTYGKSLNLNQRFNVSIFKKTKKNIFSEKKLNRFYTNNYIST